MLALEVTESTEQNDGAERSVVESMMDSFIYYYPP